MTNSSFSFVHVILSVQLVHTASNTDPAFATHEVYVHYVFVKSQPKLTCQCSMFNEINTIHLTTVC